MPGGSASIRGRDPIRFVEFDVDAVAPPAGPVPSWYSAQSAAVSGAADVSSTVRSGDKFILNTDQLGDLGGNNCHRIFRRV